MNNVIIAGIYFLCVFAAFLVGKYVVPKSKEVVNTVLDTYTFLRPWADCFVSWARQFMQSKTGHEKMDQVVYQLSKIALDAGIVMDEVQIKAIAQKAYDEMMQEANKNYENNGKERSDQ